MKKPYSVLLPVDYSDRSEYACRYALHLCKNLPAEIQFLHVYSIPYPDPSHPLEFAVDLSKVYNMEMERLKRYVMDLLDKLGYQESDLRIRMEAREGTLSNEISEYTKIVHSDLIVIGTHDREEIREYFWGTHALEIVRASGVPVLAIPEGAVYREWRKVLYATNLKLLEFTVLEFLTHLAQRADAHLEIMHVETIGEDKWETMAEFESFKEDMVKSIDYEKIRINTLYDKEDVAESLLEYAADNGFDLIAVNPSRANITERIFGKQVTKQLLYKSNLPLLCVKN